MAELVSLPAGVVAVAAIVGDMVVRMVSESLPPDQQRNAELLLRQRMPEAVVVLSEEMSG